MNTCSTPEYTMLAFAQLLSNWSKQRPSSQGDLDSHVMDEAERVYYTRMELLMVSFLFVISIWVRFKCYILYIAFGRKGNNVV